MRATEPSLDPAGEGKERAAAAAPSPQASILVVDDFESVRLYHVSYLRRKGYRCVAAESGDDALRTLESEPFDLVLLDLHMPNLNGREFLKQVRADPVRSALPVLIITSDSSPDAIQADADLKGVGVLVKPLAPDQLLAAVRRLIPGRESRDDS